MFLIAHGISVRTDLPVPEVIFWWAASIVLVVSFVALATLWPKPRLQDPGWRPSLGGLGREGPWTVRIGRVRRRSTTP